MNDYVKMTFELLGGLALFIWGMQMMGDGLQKAAGDKLRYILEKLTRKPIYGVLVGAIITGIIQSSSATTVMLVGFVNAGLMSLSQALGVIFGANIGTTVTAQLVAFKIEWIIMPAIFLGVVLRLFGTKKAFRLFGEVLLGFGILFLGMSFLSQSVLFIKDVESVKSFLASVSGNLFLGILAGAIFTGIIQSSSATSGLVIALISAGLINLTGAVGLMMGANIGTCVTALLASIGGNLGARRVALAHLMFNVIGVVVFIPFVIPVTSLMQALSSEPARQTANFHTFFNISMTIIMLPLTSYYEKLIKWIMPGKEMVAEHGIKFISDKILVTPSLALEQATQEMARMLSIAEGMIKSTREMIRTRNHRLIALIMDNENTVDSLQMAITTFISKLTQKSLSDEQADRAIVLLKAVHDVERIGDHATNLAELAEGMIDNNVRFSDAGLASLLELYDTVEESTDLVKRALTDYDKKLARQMFEKEKAIDKKTDQIRDEHIERLKTNDCKPDNGIFYLDMASNLERIGDHCVNIAQSVLGDVVHADEGHAAE